MRISASMVSAILQIAFGNQQECRKRMWFDPLSLSRSFADTNVLSSTSDHCRCSLLFFAVTKSKNYTSVPSRRRKSLLRSRMDSILTDAVATIVAAKSARLLTEDQTKWGFD